MAAGNLLLDLYLNLAPSCCVDKVYALVFNQQHQALRDDGSGVLTFQNFTSAAQAEFSIVMNEHAERLKYYFNNLASGQFDIPPTPDGEQYMMEFWRREVGGPFNRTEDILEDTRRFTWSGDQIESAGSLSEQSQNKLADWQAHVSLTYDSENLAVRLMAHLERNGKLIEDSTQMEALWLDQTGATISHIIKSDHMTNAPGVYQWDTPNLDLAPDRTSLMLCSITDADGNVHKTAQYVNCWD